MVRIVNAIFSQGAFKPIEPVSLPEGTRVHLRVEEEEVVNKPTPRVPKIHSPKLARRKDAADFVLEVREIGDASV